MHVGDLDVRHQALPGGEKQWRDWQDRKRGAPGDASPVSAHPLQFDDQMLVIWPQQASAIHWTQNTTQVKNKHKKSIKTINNLKKWLHAYLINEVV